MDESTIKKILFPEVKFLDNNFERALRSNVFKKETKMAYILGWKLLFCHILFFIVFNIVKFIFLLWIVIKFITILLMVFENCFYLLYPTLETILNLY